MREVAALLGFNILNSAGVILLQHDAGSILCVYQREASSIPLQMAERVDKLGFFHLQIIGNGRDILICQAHISLPAAAGAAALARVDDCIRFRHISR